MSNCLLGKPIKNNLAKVRLFFIPEYPIIVNSSFLVGLSNRKQRLLLEIYKMGVSQYIIQNPFHFRYNNRLNFGVIFPIGSPNHLY